MDRTMVINISEAASKTNTKIKHEDMLISHFAVHAKLFLTQKQSNPIEYPFFHKITYQTQHKNKYTPAESFLCYS